MPTTLDYVRACFKKSEGRRLKFNAQEIVKILSLTNCVNLSLVEVCIALEGMVRRKEILKIGGEHYCSVMREGLDSQDSPAELKT